MQPIVQPTKFGRLYAPDPRDQAYPMRAQVRRAEAVLRTERFWTVGPVLDQGPYPHCVGYTGQQFLASAPYMMRKGRVIPSGIDLYHAAQELDEWPGVNYDGSSGRGLMKALHKAGLITEYVWAQRIEDVRDFVLTRGPVCVGSEWFSGMSFPVWLDDGLYLKATGEYEGGHEWLIVGYSKARKAFRMVNSWGGDWAEAGRAWIRYEDANQLIFAMNGDAVSAIERVP